MAMAEPLDPRIRLVSAPAEMGRFRYLMSWHPRVETDAPHVWFRQQLRIASHSLPRLTDRPAASPRNASKTHRRRRHP
jgi:hypothetical protein